jgi:hypothetical protein
MNQLEVTIADDVKDSPHVQLPWCVLRLTIFLSLLNLSPSSAVRGRRKKISGPVCVMGGQTPTRVRLLPGRCIPRPNVPFLSAPEFFLSVVIGFVAL